ncbi:MAG TPA: hypothetical protein VHD83_17915 [Puia sp.]|nr:hypothetical protein [Puia sp.]
MDQLPRGHEVGSLLAGIGSIPTTWSLMRQTRRRRPDCIIQAGIAGSFIPGRIGQVMAIKEEALGDVGVHENHTFRTVFDMKLMDSNTHPFTNGLLVNPYQKWLDSTGLQQVRAITINEISTSPARIEWYQQNIAPVVESMEGAALHYVCLQENIPFLQLRAVSNDIGQRDKSKWDFKSSIAALNSKLSGILESLTPDLITL